MTKKNITHKILSIQSEDKRTTITPEYIAQLTTNKLVHHLHTDTFQTAQCLMTLRNQKKDPPFTPYIDALKKIKTLITHQIQLLKTLQELNDPTIQIKLYTLSSEIGCKIAPVNEFIFSKDAPQEITQKTQTIKDINTLINKGAPFRESYTIISKTLSLAALRTLALKPISKSTSEIPFLQIILATDTPLPLFVLAAGSQIHPIQLPLKDPGPFDYNTVKELDTYTGLLTASDLDKCNRIHRILKFIEHDYLHMLKTTTNLTTTFSSSDRTVTFTGEASFKKSEEFLNKIKEELNKLDSESNLFKAFEYLIFHLGHEERTFGSWAPFFIKHIVEKDVTESTFQDQLNRIKERLDPNAEKPFYAASKYKTQDVIEQIDTAARIFLKLYEISIPEFLQPQ